MLNLLASDEYSGGNYNNDVFFGHITKTPSFCHLLQQNALVVRAESVPSFVDFVLKAYTEAQRAKSSNDRGDGTFQSFTSFGEAVDTFLHRPHTLRTYENIDDKLVRYDQSGNDSYFDVVGDYLDMGRYLSGEPEMYGNMSMGNPRNIFATLYINTGAVWYISQEMLNYRAQRLMQLIDWLEHQQIRCEVIAFSSNQCAHVEIKVKDFTSYLDLDALAVVTHSDFHRRIIFRVREYSQTWSFGYGTATTLGKGDFKLPNHLQGEQGIFGISENDTKKEHITKSFDKAKTDIIEMMDNGYPSLQLDLKGGSNVSYY